jgi:hypothetical protein
MGFTVSNVILNVLAPDVVELLDSRGDILSEDRHVQPRETSDVDEVETVQERTPMRKARMMTETPIPQPEYAGEMRLISPAGITNTTPIPTTTSTMKKPRFQFMLVPKEWATEAYSEETRQTIRLSRRLRPT